MSQAVATSLYHLVHRLGKILRATEDTSGVPTAQLSALVTVVMHGPLPMTHAGAL